MAVTSDQIKTEYPLPVYNYRVDFGTDTIAFSEVSGLNIAFDTTVYKESQVTSGKAGPVVRVMPAQGTPANITLTKGVVRKKSISALYNWINSIKINQVEKKDIHIHLCDEKGDAVLTWTVTNAFPTQLDVPNFDANSNDVAIETIELIGDGVVMKEH